MKPNLFKNGLKCISWNARGIMYGGRFLCDLLSSTDIDVCAISEHFLFDDNLDFLNSLDAAYTYVGVCDSSLNPYDPCRRGKGGVALIWKKSISASAIILPEEDRIIGITIQEKGLSPIFIFCVYAPSSNSRLDTYREFVDKLYNLYAEYHSLGTVILLGDFKAEISGSRYKARVGTSERILSKFIKSTCQYSLVSDICCTGPKFTYDPYKIRTNRSLTDHALLESSKHDLVADCYVYDDNIFNMSDHLPFIFTFKCHTVIKVPENKQYHVNLKNFRC